MHIIDGTPLPQECNILTWQKGYFNPIFLSSDMILRLVLNSLFARGLYKDICHKLQKFR